MTRTIRNLVVLTVLAGALGSACSSNGGTGTSTAETTPGSTPNPNTSGGPTSKPTEPTAHNEVEVGPAFGPQTIDFGAANVGATVERIITVKNSPDRERTITSVDIAGDNAADFVLRENQCVPGIQLSAGDSCDLRVAFTPPAPGRRSAVLSIVVSPPAGRQVLLIGEGE